MPECSTCDAFMTEDARFDDFGETEIRYVCPNCGATEHETAW